MTLQNSVAVLWYSGRRAKRAPQVDYVNDTLLSTKARACASSYIKCASRAASNRRIWWHNLMRTLMHGVHGVLLVIWCIIWCSASLDAVHQILWCMGWHSSWGDFAVWCTLQRHIKVHHPCISPCIKRILMHFVPLWGWCIIWCISVPESRR